jgi:hypothetical protein
MMNKRNILEVLSPQSTSYGMGACELPLFSDKSHPVTLIPTTIHRRNHKKPWYIEHMDSYPLFHSLYYDGSFINKKEI